MHEPRVARRYIQCYQGDTRCRQKLPEAVAINSLTPETAAKLLRGPRVLGNHPETGLPVLLKQGRYGAYFEHGTLRYSVGRLDEVESSTLDAAIMRLDVKAARFGARAKTWHLDVCCHVVRMLGPRSKGGCLLPVQ
jgi:DNA topoisomerase I